MLRELYSAGRRPQNVEAVLRIPQSSSMRMGSGAAWSAVSFLVIALSPIPLPADAKVWFTTQDLTQALSEAPALRFTAAQRNADSEKSKDFVRVDVKTTYQTLLGMGSSFEHSTCYNLSLLNPRTRDETIRRLVDSETGIGMNLMRICIGTPDFTGEPWYTYDDLPKGEVDPELKHFSIDKDRKYVLPVLKAALARNPQLLLFASPWSPPGWMKSTGSVIGGRVLPEHYPAYALYFVKFLKAYEAEGIPIHAVTVQNEPGVDRDKDPPKWHYPSCRWTGQEERDFIRDHLGPALKANGLPTRIWCYDHNFNVGPTEDGDDPGIDYPRIILSDPAAAAFVEGVAFHGYAGKPEGMRILHEEFPDHPVFFTEGSVYGLPGANRIIDLLSNGASSFNAWVTMLDERGKPNNGPFPASRTLIELKSQDRSVEYTLDYYLYGQFMKFLQRGAVRVATDTPRAGCPSIAFRNPDGTVVVVLVNHRARPRSLEVLVDQSAASLDMPPRSVATIVVAED